jgi:signal transduction histidine kinase
VRHNGLRDDLCETDPYDLRRTGSWKDHPVVARQISGIRIPSCVMRAELNEIGGPRPVPAFARVSALGDRHPGTADALLALAVSLVCIPEAVTDHQHRLGVIFFAVALSLPLVWRRRQPSAVFLVLAALAFAQWLVHINVIGDVSLLIALYTVAVNESRLRTAVAASILELGAVLAAISDGGFREFIGLSALSVASGVLGTSVRHRRALLASLEDRATRLELALGQQGLIAAAAERARIAREMHDIVAHNLTVMIALADGAVFAAARAPEKATTAMETVSVTGRQALTEMRRLLGVLRDDDEGSTLVPQPGVPQIDQLVEQVRAAGLPVTLEVAGNGRALPGGAQLTVFRLVQEALTNSLKHAGASAAASVRLRYAADEIDVEVTDSGTPRPLARTPGGRGLEGMRERAAVYAGTVEAGPRAGGGWRVHAHLWLDRTTAAG